MSRYIDADVLVIDYYDDYETKDDVYTYTYVSKAQIDSAPSIDIVRCGECEHWHSGNCWGIPFSGDDASYIETESNDFCSYGEREGE